MVAALQATRTTGVAPLAVLFDATGTTSSTAGVDTFRQVTYSFDFGDERGKTWAVSGVSKNVQTGGPLSAHVFDVAGTYTVKVRATDASGGVSEATVTVTVQDPNTFYAGTKTICVSAASNFTGCPSGATQQTTLPSVFNGKRVLLRAGESFSDISIQDGNSQVIVGSFGTGAKPRVNSVGVGSWRPDTANFANDITVMDMAVINGMTQSIGSRVLFYRNDLTTAGGTNSIYFGGIKYWAQDDPYRRVATSQFQQAREIFLVENNVTGSVSGDGYNVFGDGSRIALLGNVMGTSAYHTVRLTAAHKAVVAHNELRGISGGGIYHSLKVHAGGLKAYADSYSVSGYSWASEQIVVANNTLGSASDNNQWTVAICPQNDQYSEGLQNVIVAGNKFIRGRSTVQDLTFGGRRMTYRNNTVNTGASLTEGVGHTGALPAEWNGPYYSN